MSFTTEIKNEICSNDYSNLENICFLSGFVRNNAVIDDGVMIITSENLKVVRRIFSLFKGMFGVSPTYEQIRGNNLSRKSAYNIYVKDKLSTICDSLMFSLDDLPSYFLDTDDLKRAYLSGAFLAKGSINDPKKSRYHLEFLVDNSFEADYIMKILNYFDLHAKVISRDKGYMTYVKEAEKIGDFLRIVSANNAVLYYEDIRIYRDHKNMTNRLNNMEQANVDKSISASGKQLEDIELIKEKIGLDAIDDKLKDVIIYREKYKEASLSELSEIISIELDKKITKSGLSHRLRKIKEIADRLREND